MVWSYSVDGALGGRLLKHCLSVSYKQKPTSHSLVPFLGDSQKQDSSYAVYHPLTTDEKWN